MSLLSSMQTWYYIPVVVRRSMRLNTAAFLSGTQIFCMSVRPSHASYPRRPFVLPCHLARGDVHSVRPTDTDTCSLARIARNVRRTFDRPDERRAGLR